LQPQVIPRLGDVGLGFAGKFKKLEPLLNQVLSNRMFASANAFLTYILVSLSGVG
jgi:hypothetical protein